MAKYATRMFCHFYFEVKNLNRNIKLFYKRNQGFSLWEVILIFALSGMIAFLAIPSFLPAADRVKSEAHQANLLQIERAVQLYYLDMGKYPERIEALATRPQGEEKWQGPYLWEIPVYPYDAEKKYIITTKGKIAIR
ncbi:MAG: prepilin-type cleavage/methylation domain-containing protein [Peptococcaceae bacterium]|nr:prepilin-type cleavage/methylation domain-containing protein [Peptococcaceae bacterium]